MAIIITAHQAFVARNPILRHVLRCKSLAGIPTATAAKIVRPNAAIKIASQRVSSGAVESQSQRPPFNEEEPKKVTDNARANRAASLNTVPPEKSNVFG